MQNAVRYGVLSAAFIGTLCGAACADKTELYVNPQGPDTTHTNPSESFIPATGTATAVPTRKTAAGYPMQYWISVPKGWPGNRAWPVVVAVAGSGRDYEVHANRFAKVRDDNNYPFIIVTPVTLTNSGDGPVPRTQPQLDFPTSTWDLIDQVGRCAFDLAGLQAVMADIRNLYAGQSKDFVTGFSGGGNTIWPILFLKPELTRAISPVAVNYSGRCITEEVPAPKIVSTAEERVLLPIKLFNGADDPGLAWGSAQQKVATDLARANGYTNVSTSIVPGRIHDPMPDVVLGYFYSMLNANEK